MIYHKKLVRDRIPEIIQQAGKECEIEIIKDNNKVIDLLEEKVLEEWAEYQESKSVEEIADTIEVLFSLAERYGTSREMLLSLVKEKSEKRGGFENGIYLISVNDM